MKTSLKKVTPIILGIIMITVAFRHLLVPEVYAPIITDFIDQRFANVLAAIAEG